MSSTRQQYVALVAARNKARADVRHANKESDSIPRVDNMEANGHLLLAEAVVMKTTKEAKQRAADANAALEAFLTAHFGAYDPKTHEDWNVRCHYDKW